MRYLKFIAQALTAALVAVLPFLTGSDVMGVTQWVNVAIIGLGAICVFSGENTAASPAAKAVFSGVAAATVIANDIISSAGGVLVFGPADWVQIILALLGPAAVYGAKNKNARKV